MSRLKKIASRLWTKKAASASQAAHETALLAAAAALAKYNPDNHPDIIAWLATSESSGSKNVGMHQVPLQTEPSRGLDGQFRRSWNGFLPALGISDGSMDIAFDQLRTVDILGPAEPRGRNDSGLSLFEDFTRPPGAARKHPAKGTGSDDAEMMWELSERWETREGMMRDLIEEHAAGCRKCWHEGCWACVASKKDDRGVEAECRCSEKTGVSEESFACIKMHESGTNICNNSTRWCTDTLIQYTARL